MITADRSASADGAPLDAAAASSTAAPGKIVASPPASRSRLGIATDLACGLLFIAVGVAAAFPLVWGLALQQTPMAVSGIAAELMCLIALLNRLFAPVTASRRAVPFLAALEERPLVLLACLACAATAAVTLVTCWPIAAG